MSVCVCACGEGGGGGGSLSWERGEAGHLDAGESVVCQGEPPQVREVVQTGELPETKATHTYTRHLVNTTVHM